MVERIAQAVTRYLKKMGYLDKESEIAQNQKQANLFAESESLMESRRDEFDEPRFLCIAKIGNVCWSAIVAFRDKRIRSISVRRARSTEIKIYEKK